MSWRGKLLSGIALVSVISVLVWIALDRAPRTVEVKLPDGRTIQVVGVTYGTNHSLVKGLPAKIARFVPSREATAWSFIW